MVKKKYLVTGGSGFIGSALVKKLVKTGHDVRVFDNNSRGNAQRLSCVMEDIEFIEGDIRNPKDVEDAVKGVDSICHLAFVNGTQFFYENPVLVLEVGIKGMMNTLDAAIKHKISEFVFASSSEVYQSPTVIPTPEEVPLVIPDPMNSRYSYGGGKLIGELLAINYGRKYFDNTLIFRPHNVYGPDMGEEHVIPQLVRKMGKLIIENGEGPISFPIQGTGSETRAFIYIDDFIDGLNTVLEKGETENIYHIGNDSEISIAQLVSHIARYFKRDVRIVPGELTAGSTHRRCPDISKIKRLGFRPKYNLQDGLGATIPWYTK